MATQAIDAPAHTTGRTPSARRIRKIFGNIHEISEMPNLIEVQRESYEQFLRSDPSIGYVSGLEKTLRSVFPIEDFAGTAHLDFDRYELEPGDSFCFDAIRPHMYVNEGEVPARGIWFVIARKDVTVESLDDLDHDHGHESAADPSKAPASAVDVLQVMRGLPRDR